MPLVVGMCLHCRSLHQCWQTHCCIRDYWNILWYLIFKTWAIFSSQCCLRMLYAQMYVYNTLVPRPSPSFPSLAVQLAEEGLVYFLTWVTSWTGQIMWMWATWNNQKQHILKHDYSELKDSSARRLFCCSSWNSREDIEWCLQKAHSTGNLHSIFFFLKSTAIYSPT